MKVQQVVGNVSWNLPSRITYTPYSFLFPVINVSNPTTVERRYKIVFRLVSPQGVVLGEYTPYDWFAVSAQSYVTLLPTFWTNMNGVILNLALVEETEGEIVVLSCELTTPVVQTLSEVVQPVLGIGLMAVVMRMVTEALI